MLNPFTVALPTFVDAHHTRHPAVNGQGGAL